MCSVSAAVTPSFGGRDAESRNSSWPPPSIHDVGPRGGRVPDERKPCPSRSAAAQDTSTLISGPPRSLLDLSTINNHVTHQSADQRAHHAEDALVLQAVGPTWDTYRRDLDQRDWRSSRARSAGMTLPWADLVRTAAGAPRTLPPPRILRAEQASLMKNNGRRSASSLKPIPCPTASVADLDVACVDREREAIRGVVGAEGGCVGQRPHTKERRDVGR